MKLIALDIETTGLNPRTDRIHGVGVVQKNEDGTYNSAYLPPDHEGLRQHLANPNNHIVGHNIRFDLKFLIQAGLTVNCQVWDTKLLAQLLNENQPLGLKDLSREYFGETSLTGKKELDRLISQINGRSVADLCARDLDDPAHPYQATIAEYCIEDCINTLNLFFVLTEEIKRVDAKMRESGYLQTPLSYYQDEAMPLELVLMDMELRGIALNETGLRQFKEQLLTQSRQLQAEMSLLAAQEITKIEENLYEEAIAKKKSDKGKANVQRRSIKHGTKFNWQSSEHLSELVFNRFGISTKAVEATATGKPSTSESSLTTLYQTLQEEHPLKKILGTFKAWKKTTKLLTTYTGEDKGLLAQIEGGRIYAEYLQAGRGKDGTTGGTVTGRLSSRNPNMQNLPRGRDIKQFFIPDAGQIFVYFDYSQLELRLAAHLSQDPLLMKGYNEGVDLHQMTADAIGADRQVGKAVNFAMIYDASAYRLSSMIEKSVDDCQHIINEFYNLYKGYKKYLAAQRRFMEVHSCVISEAGRVRRLADLQNAPTMSKEWRHALKQGYNFPIQSLGASITKRAMIELHRRKFRIVTQVHDSVVITLPEHEMGKAKEIQQIAENVYKVSVPLKADVKLLTSLAESDIIQTKEITNEQHSNDWQNKTRGGSTA
jgi:DNA polymerase-1